MTKTQCPRCAGERWVCENHPDRAWNQTERGCECGAGMPCGLCNPCTYENAPAMSPGFEVEQP